MRNALLCLMLFASVASGQDKDTIRFPVQPAAPLQPVAVVSKLTASTFYVVDSDVPILVTASPLGIVSITEEAGPIKVRGVFADGNGKTETRTYRGKQVFFIEATATGAVEILVIPQAAKSASDIIRKQLDVDAGKGPLPPPVPPDPPTPKPPAPTPSPIQVPGLHVLIVEEKMQLAKMPPAQLAIRTDPQVRKYLEAKCATEPDGTHKAYRIWDKDTPAGNDLLLWQDALARSRDYSYTDATGKAIHVKDYTPWVIISNHPSGGYEGPLPANVPEMLKLLKKYGG